MSIKSNQSARELDRDAFQALVNQVDSKNALKRVTGMDTRRLEKLLKDFNIDYSHFPMVSVDKSAKPLEFYLRENIITDSGQLKNKLLKAGLKQWKCERCERTEWAGLPIPLDLHHKNEDHKDNRIENLEVICCNCHASFHRNNKKKKNCGKRVGIRKYKMVIPQCKSAKEVCVLLGIRPSAPNFQTIEGVRVRHGLNFAKDESPSVNKPYDKNEALPIEPLTGLYTKTDLKTRPV